MNVDTVANEDQNSLSLNSYWARLLHRRWWFLLPMFCGWALVVAASWIMPAKYRSETVILIEQQQVPEHYVASNVSIDLQQRLQSMTEQILSRTRLLGVIEKFHLYGVGSSQAVDADAVVDRMRKDIKVDVIRAQGNRNDLSSFKIAYIASSGALAQQVTGELTDLFIRENLASQTRLSENTTEFLDAQLTEARNNLNQQEQRLRQFKSQYLGQLPEQVQSNVQILSGLQARVQATRDALHTAEQQRLYLESLLTQLRGMRPPVRVTEGGAVLVSPLQAAENKLQTLKATLTELIGKGYTARHPDIIRLNSQIAEAERLKARLEAEAARPKSDTAPAVPQVDTQTAATVAQVESQLKANELEIANRNKELKQVESQMEQYQGRLNLAPVREQQLAELTRDHDQSKKYYESLLAKKQQSEMATNLEKRQQGEQFRMIDPPSLPSRPFSPNRLLMSGAGVAFGAVLGLALVLLLELKNPKVYLVSELRNLVPVPVLAEVPPLLTQQERRRKVRSIVFEWVAASLMLALIPIMTLLAVRKG